MAKKLAITIAGAVSLGSYEAGVMFEILDAVGQHNRWATQNNRTDERVEIDVLTGASAGGMTVAIIAQRLLFDGAAMSQPYDNPLYNAWVKDIDISKLLDRGEDELATHSIFSSDSVIAISQTYLKGRYAAGSLPAPAPHPALSSDGALKLGLAMSNLNGIDYLRRTISGGSFTYTEHQDQILLDLHIKTHDRPEVWETIRGAAVACGAFPIAFRVQDVARNIVDYPQIYLDKSLWGGNPSRFFTYTDGGVFQNQPLGMAKNLVEDIPGSRLNALDRGYLFIAPQPKTSAQIPYTEDTNANTASAFGSAVGTYKAVLERIALSIFGQAAFQDWITAEEVNCKIKLLDERAHDLLVFFLDHTLSAAQTRPVSDALLGKIFDPAKNATAVQQLADARSRLRQQYAPEYSQFKADQAMADAWIDSVLVFEQAAHLGDKEEMLIYDFVADTTKLASNGLEAFEGFFDLSYRKHDYDYGRSVAQQKLGQYKGKPDSVFANLHWTPQPIDAIDPALNDLDLSKVDIEKREQVKDQIKGAADALLKELDIELVARKVVEVAFIDGRIKKMLSL